MYVIEHSACFVLQCCEIQKLSQAVLVCAQERDFTGLFQFIYVNFILTFSILTSPHREIVSGYICTKLTRIQFYGEKDQWKFQALIFSYSYSRSNKCTEKTSWRWVDGQFFFFLKKSVFKSISYMKLKFTAIIVCIKIWNHNIFKNITGGQAETFHDLRWNDYLKNQAHTLT